MPYLGEAVCFQLIQWVVRLRDYDVAEWYRRSAESGDFRGQISHAGVLAQRGDLDGAAHWLRCAAEAAWPDLLRRVADDLDASPQPFLREMAAWLRERADAREREGVPATTYLRQRVRLTTAQL